MENNFVVENELFKVQHSSLFDSLEITFKGALEDLITSNNKRAKELWYRLSLQEGAFHNCMMKYGIKYYDDEEDPSLKGFIMFEGLENEIYLKFARNEVTATTIICEIMRMYYDDGDYVSSVFKEEWSTIVMAFYNVYLSYFSEIDCLPANDSVANKVSSAANKPPAAAAKAQEPISANLEKQLRRTRLHGLAETRRNQLIASYKPALKEAMAKEKAGLPAPPSAPEPEYNTNENVEMPAFGNLRLRTLLENNVRDVEHRFAVCFKNAAQSYAIEAADIEVKPEHINAIIRSPISSLAFKGFMCEGVNPSYVGTSIDSSDILIMLVQTTDHYEDDTYMAGIATLKVKPDAVEIDLICSNVGYKMAGIMLMDKAMRTARLLGLEKIELASVSTPATVQFYKRLGFKKVVGNRFAQSVEMKGLIPYRRRLTRKVRAPAWPAAGPGAAAPVMAAAEVKALFDKTAEKAGAAVVKKAKHNVSNNALWAKQNALWVKAGKARKTRRLSRK
jgi:hypothetical protein